MLSIPGNIKVAKVLLENGADINARNQHKQTPLHLVAFLGNLYAISQKGELIEIIRWYFVKGGEKKRQLSELLIQNGADIAARDDKNRTPSKFAAEVGNITLKL